MASDATQPPTPDPTAATGSPPDAHGSLLVVPVVFSDDAMDGIRDRALRRVADHARRRRRHPERGRGRAPTLENNFKGVAGEQAALRVLRELLHAEIEVLDVADRSDTPADIHLITPRGVLGVEVKFTITHTGWFWPDRMIPGDQLAATSANLYVWVTSPQTRFPSSVYVVGWNPTVEIRNNHTAQIDTGFTPRRFPQATSRRTHASDYQDVAPYSGLDDPGFDDFEWAQDQLDPQVTDDDDWAEDAHENALWERPGDAQTLSVLLDPSRAREEQRKPGFGGGDSLVRVTASPRNLSLLPAWVHDWTPTDDDS